MNNESLTRIKPAAEEHDLSMSVLERKLVVSVIATTLVFLFGTWGMIWLISGDFALALGVGAFCAFWGGPGFGVMVGGAAWSRWSENRSAESLAEHQLTLKAATA